MAENESEDTYLDRPNRRKASSKATKAIVALLLVVSAALVIIISIGGWDTLEGAKPLQIAYIVIYLVMAFLVMRWNRGVLPLAAALAIVLLIFAAVSGPAWFDRDKTGLTDPTLDEGILGLLSLILVPIQILLIAFAMRGFQQAWNVEVERSTDARRGSEPRPRTRLSHRFGPTHRSSLATEARRATEIVWPFDQRHSIPEQVQMLGEDAMDLQRPVGEHVAGIRVDLLAMADAVDEAAAVGMDQPADQHLGERVRDLPPPARQLDRPRVLEARAMLGQQARPLLRVREHPHEVVGPTAHDGDGVRGYDGANGANAFADETGVSGVEGNPQARCAREPRDVPVAEVHPEQIAVSATCEVPDAVCGVTAGRAGPAAQSHGGSEGPRRATIR